MAMPMRMIRSARCVGPSPQGIGSARLTSPTVGPGLTMHLSDISCRDMSPPDRPPVELSATGRVILGMIAFGKRTGYDIKVFVDRTTRHFWAASYGQIYPELKRLEEQGLVRGQPEPSGGRARTVYELTEAGVAALEGWLSSDAEPLYELRDEGMLKLF